MPKKILREIPDGELIDEIAKGREACLRLRTDGKEVPEYWTEALAKLEGERERREINRLMQAEGFAVVWSSVLGEMIAFARDDVAASQVPGGVICYSLAEMEMIVGHGHDADMLKLIHEAKKHGGRVKA